MSNEEENAAFAEGFSSGCEGTTRNLQPKIDEARKVQHALRADRDTSAQLVAGMIGGLGAAGVDFWERTQHLWPEATREIVARALADMKEHSDA